MIETSHSKKAGSVPTPGSTAGPTAEAPGPRAALGAPSVEALPPTIQRTLRDDQICVLTFDRPGSSANIFDRRTLTELREQLELVAGSPEIKGLVLTSAKRSIFIAGADLNMLSETASPPAGRPGNSNGGSHSRRGRRRRL